MKPSNIPDSASFAPQWRGGPAWLLSLAAHLAAAIVGALLIRVDPPKGMDEGDRPAAIVLARRSETQTQYFSDAATERHEVLRPATETMTGGQPLPADDPPTIEGLALPELPGGLPAGEGLVAAPRASPGSGKPRLFAGLDDEAILAEDAKIPREVAPTGPTARVSLFGAAAEGRSFVFVIDRSKSMGADGLGVIQAAAGELKAQLGRLAPEQSLQVVAYNQSPALLGERSLLPATEGNKARVVEFVSNLAAFGQTEHSPALIAALRLKPEVIFLLTDGGYPPLDEGQLRAIRELSGGRTSIHCLHFGRGPHPGQSFLERLARQNRGSYVYIDVTGR